MPQILLREGAVRLVGIGIGKNAVERMAAADPRGLHPARGGKIGRAETEPVHPRACGRDLGDVLDALSGFQQGMDEDRLGDLVASLKQREVLVDEVDVPRTLDFGDHDDVELVADRADDLAHIVEKPRAVQCVDPGPQAGVAEVGSAGNFDEPGSCRLLGLRRDGIFEIAEQNVDLFGHVRHPRADLLQMRREEMDHPLRPDRELAHRLRRPDRQRLVELDRQFHGFPPEFSSQLHNIPAGPTRYTEARRRSNTRTGENSRDPSANGEPRSS